MESSALRKRAAWLHSVAIRLPTREVADMLDHYAEEMMAEAEYADRHGGVVRIASRTRH